MGAHGKAVGWGTTLQTRKLQVQFPVASQEFLIDLIISAILQPLGSTQPLTEISTSNISLGGGG